MYLFKKKKTYFKKLTYIVLHSAFYNYNRWALRGMVATVKMISLYPPFLGSEALHSLVWYICLFFGRLT